MTFSNRGCTYVYDFVCEEYGQVAKALFGANTWAKSVRKVSLTAFTLLWKRKKVFEIPSRRWDFLWGPHFLLGPRVVRDS